MAAACARPVMGTEPAQQPVGTPKIVIRVGPPGEGAAAPANPFDGTSLPPLQGPSPLDAPKRVVLEAPLSEVPMMDNHGLPGVDVNINGSGPYRFVVDWGANIFAMSPQIAVGLNLPVLGVDDMANLSWLTFPPRVARRCSNWRSRDTVSWPCWILARRAV